MAINKQTDKHVSKVKTGADSPTVEKIVTVDSSPANEFNILQLAVDLYTTPSLDGDGAGNLGTPIETTLGTKVTGPASVTDIMVPVFDGVTGKLIKETGVSIDGSDNVTGVVALGTTGDITITKSLPSVILVGSKSWKVQENSGVVNIQADESGFTTRIQISSDPTNGNISVLGEGAGNATLRANAQSTGDASVELRVNNVAANTWAMTNDNSDSDRLKFLYNSVEKLRLETDGTLVIQSFSISGSFSVAALITGAVISSSIETDELTISNPTVPATASSPGVPGQIAWDSGFIYVAVGVDTWKRAAIVAGW